MKMREGTKIQNLNISISKEAKLKLKEMQLAIRRQTEQSDQATTPGKLVEKLILSNTAILILQKEYSGE